MSGPIRHVVAAAYRKRHPMTGIGGAGGALQIQEAVFGAAWEDLQFSYSFAPETPPELNGVLGALAAGYQAARTEGLNADLPPARRMEDLPASWLQQDRYVLEAVAWGRQLAQRWPEARFFVHEPATAFGLASCGASYTLVYHHQGSLATEQVESFGRILHPGAPRWWSLIERVAMRCAVETYFPSSGAREAYLKAAGIQEKEAGRIGPSLYNTILPPSDTAGRRDEELIQALPKDRILFASIGAFSPAKGLDRVPEFLSRYRRHTGRPLCWLARGDGAYRERIFEEIRRHDLEKDAIVVEDRIANTTLRLILERTSCYIMLHRRSIFDLATLEALSAGCCTVLSRTTGNLDFDLDGACLMVEDGAEEHAAIELARMRLEDRGDLARATFERHFSHAPYRARYERAFERLAAHARAPEGWRPATQDRQ